MQLLVFRQRRVPLKPKSVPAPQTLNRKFKASALLDFTIFGLTAGIGRRASKVASMKLTQHEKPLRLRKNPWEPHDPMRAL